MNGRVYDYNVGRFMSVDPFIQTPGNQWHFSPVPLAQKYECTLQ